MSTSEAGLNRREFLALSAAGVGSGLALGVSGDIRWAEGGLSDRINVALIGHGSQGQVLFDAMRDIPGLHFQTVCDIWDYNRGAAASHVRALPGSFIPKAYVDIDEMLATEKGLDAAIIATPDFWHAPHAVKCLEAGLHVYCEKMMSNTIEGARTIVRAAGNSGKLCQIGYQRRSNPRYRFTLEQLIRRHRICGRIAAFNSQWNRSLASSRDIAIGPMSRAIDPEVLKRYGYRDMHQFRNWRHSRDLAGGLISSLASHQLDVCAWFLGGVPKSVMASGGNDFFKDREVFDNIMAMLEYEMPGGTVRAFSQVHATTEGSGGYYERFMGTWATIDISERAQWTRIVPDQGPKFEGPSRAQVQWGRSVPVGSGDPQPSWWELERRGFLNRIVSAPEMDHETGKAIGCYDSVPLPNYALPGGLNKSPHQPHLENFFAAIRGEASLNCDARTAFLSEAPVYFIDSAARNRQPINYTPEQLNC